VARGIFVAGTDTEIGKTLAAAALLRCFGAMGLRSCGMKPVTAGAERREGCWRSADGDVLASASSMEAPMELRTPYILTRAVSPHLAAAHDGARVDLLHIARCYAALAERADLIVVEGTGGWHAPLSFDLTMADLARALRLPVVLVVGIRLGCLSHALLTARAIRDAGLTLSGWLANRGIASLPEAADNIAFLDRRLGAPRLGDIPFVADPVEAAAHLDALQVRRTFVAPL